MKRGPKPGNRVCTLDSCIEPHLAKGYCRFHYRRFHRYGDPLFTPARPRTPRLSNRILDILQTDGGWLTADGILLELGGDLTAAQVRDALYDALRFRVEHRAVGLASSRTRGPNGFEVRAEWRAKR